MRRLVPLALALLAASAASHADDAGVIGSAAAFNPRLSLILDGNLYHDDQHGRGGELVDGMAGIQHGADVGEAEEPLQNGFNLGESELVLSAAVDPYFDGQLTLAVGADGGVALEESWLQTRRLPAGLKLKMGKFLSGIGYQNSRHRHAWDFADQNLAYLGALGGESLKDTGVQLTWIAPTPFYLLLGAEALQGNDQDRFGALIDNHDAGSVTTLATPFPAVKAGPRLGVVYARFAPDLGDTYALQLGLSHARADQYQQLIDTDATPLSRDEYALDGNQRLYGLDVVYKRDSAGEYGAGDFALSGEVLRLKKSMTVVAADVNSPLAAGATVHGTQDGYYLQASYGIAPRWQLAARFDATGLNSELDLDGMTAGLASSRRTSLALAFLPSEFARIRVQLGRGDIAEPGGGSTRLTQVYLQYTHSLGPHGAHTF